MLKGQIKAISIACICILISPLASYSLDKEEFIKFLINSSYPETKKEEIKDIEKEEDDIKEPENKTTSNEDGFIKIYVGEENKPKETNKEEANKEETSENNASETMAEYSKEYKNEMRITKEKPTMLIYHTHAGETYSDSPDGNYHSKNIDKSVISVGASLTETLSQKGWGIIHSTKYNDYPDFNRSYLSSLTTVKNIMSTNNSIKIAIDLHRDGRNFTDEESINKFHESMTTTINGEKVAKFFFVVGQRNENVEEIRALAQDLTNFAQKKYPGLVMPVVEKPNGKFNQYLASKHMLIEVGGNGNSSEEAKAATEYIAEILDEYFNSYK